LSLGENDHEAGGGGEKQFKKEVETPPDIIGKDIKHYLGMDH